MPDAQAQQPGRVMGGLVDEYCSRSARRAPRLHRYYKKKSATYKTNSKKYKPTSQALVALTISTIKTVTSCA